MSIKSLPQSANYWGHCPNKIGAHTPVPPPKFSSTHWTYH